MRVRTILLLLVGAAAAGCGRDAPSRDQAAVEARTLPSLRGMDSRRAVFAAIGRGLLWERSVGPVLGEGPPPEVEQFAWEIHDGRRNTGFELLVLMQGDRVLGHSHPWSRP